MKRAPKVLTRMRLSCCWGDNLDEKELNEVVDYIDDLEQQVKKQKEVIDKAIMYIDDLRDESAERQGFYNCFPDDLYIPNIKELLDILKEVSE